MTKPIRVIGIGSPVAEDSVGIEAVERLRQEAQWAGRSDIEWLVLERPGATLLHYLTGVERVCLIDALNHPVAGVYRIAPAELLAQAGAISSHDFGVAEALRLAQGLGQLPPHLVIYGIAPPTDGGWEGWYPQLCSLLGEALPPGGQLP
ncbi:MAG: hydrogenase maturation protease [Gammaproteobacteria bacterium]|nr:hydrogenase maturation protease [Gammaproteobacteria bacterium]